MTLPRWVLAGLVVASLASCSAPDGDRTAAPGASRGGGRATTAGCAVRSDLSPIMKRFPLFGSPRRAHWCGVSLNGGDERVPGPSDVRMVGVVELTGAAFDRVVAAMGGRPVAETPDKLPGEITGFLPRQATWLRSQELDRAISRGLYTASFLVDRAHRAVIMDCVDPVLATGGVVVTE